MRQHLERVRRGLWTFRQPLTHAPSSARAAVSDLFVWRRSPQWQTHFELIDICGLFETAQASRDARIFVFDERGRQCGETRVPVPSNTRRTFDLSELTARCGGETGTFCVFHETPAAIAEWGSFLAERGYVSYRYADAPLRSYAHGNLDAVALNPDRGIEALGSGSFRAREYRLQHALTGPAIYEFALVNPTDRPQRASCRIDYAHAAQRGEVLQATLEPLGCHVFRVEIDAAAPARAVIQSHLVMARPLVFRIQNGSADVFHG